MFDGRSRMFMINPVMQAAITAWLAGVDLRRARPPFACDWRPPRRPHSLRREAADLRVDRDDFG
jgi:hypothetical protein